MNPLSVVKKYLITALDGKDYNTNYYNLDMIIALGYRVKSTQGTQFRIWATGEPLLQGAGKIRHTQAMKKVDVEYKVYQEQTLTPVKKAYLQSIKALEQKVSKKKK